MKNIITLMFAFFPVFIYSQITFEKTIGGMENDQGNMILQTAGGGYIIAGNTYSFGAGEYDIYLVKTDENGDTLWTKTYGDIAADYGNAILETGDGGYIIAGITETYDDNWSSVYLIRTNENGDTLWTRSYRKGRYCRAADIKTTTDGGYIVAGSAQTHNPESNDFFLMKTDSVGDSLWAKTYGGDDAERANAIQVTSDGGYILAGFTESYGAGSEDIYVVKTDSNGVSLWEKTYGGTGSEYGTGILKTAEDGFIIGGYTDSYGAGYDDCYLVRITSTGDTIWTKTFGGSSHDNALAINHAADGGFILTGYTNSYATEVYGHDAYMIKTDQNGDSAWTRVYGAEYTDIFLDVIQTSDDGYLAVGFTGSFGAEGLDLYLVKTDGIGMMTGISKLHSNSIQSYKLFPNFPNPFNPVTMINYQLPMTSYVELHIYNTLGQKIETLVSEKQAAGKYQVKWDASQYASSIYYYQIIAGEYREAKKMILIR